MEYTVNDEVIRETGCLFKGKVNDVMAAGKVWNEDDKENKYVILKVKDIEVSKKLAGIIGDYRRKDFIPFSAGDNFCILSPYMKKRGIKDYVYTVAENFEEIVNVCKSMVNRIFWSELPYSIKYLLLKERKINVNEEGRIYFTYDFDLSNFDEEKSERECARECGYIIEELLNDEKYAEFIIVKLIKKKNSHGGYENFGEIIEDVKNMSFLGRVPKRFDNIKDFILRRERIIVMTIAIIFAIVVGIAGIKLFYNVMDINRSFDVIGTENLAEP